jgi:hypothetical protein
MRFTNKIDFIKYLIQQNKKTEKSIYPRANIEASNRGNPQVVMRSEIKTFISS